MSDWLATLQSPEITNLASLHILNLKIHIDKYVSLQQTVVAEKILV